MPVPFAALRPDRILTLGCIHPAMRITARAYRRRVPILMYHGIREGLGKRAAYFETNTSPESFAAHMQYLKDHGYTTVTLGQTLDYTAGRIKIEKPVVITFDDGYKDFYTNALPILRRHSLTATMFIISNFAGIEQRSFGDNECMTWSEIREICSHGIEIGSHTASHPVLRNLSRQSLADELWKSKVAIEDHLGRPIVSFSYPFAFPEQDKLLVQNLRVLLRECGYENGVSTIVGTAGISDEAYFLPRLPINSYDDLRLLRAKLDGAYDWLHIAQRAYKSLINRTAHGAAQRDTSVAEEGSQV